MGEASSSPIGYHRGEWREVGREGGECLRYRFYGVSGVYTGESGREGAHGREPRRPQCSRPSRRQTRLPLHKTVPFFFYSASSSLLICTTPSTAFFQIPLKTKLNKNKFNILQIAGRNLSKLKSLSKKHKCKYTTQFEDVITNADLYIICVSDDAIKKVFF